MQVSKPLSIALMVANLIATVLVISIHYRSKIPLTPGAIHSLNYLVQEFITNGIAKICVPFFAMISSFFLVDKFQNHHSYTSIIRNKIRTLVIPYLLASTLIFICLESLKTLSKHQHHDSLALLDIFHSIALHPVSVQFWFLRDLILLMAISPILIKSPTFICRSLLLVTFGLWLADLQLFPIVSGWYLISIDTLFFFCLGITLRKNNILEKLLQLGRTTQYAIFIAWLLLTAFRVWLQPDFDLWYKTNFTTTTLAVHKLSILLGIASLIHISAMFNQKNPLIYISGFTFFAYLFHYVPLSYFKSITQRLISPEYAFYLNFPVAMVLVFWIAHLTSSYLPKFYWLISGERSPQKTIERIVEKDGS